MQPAAPAVLLVLVVMGKIMLVSPPGGAFDTISAADGAAALSLPSAAAPGACADQVLTDLYRAHYRSLVRMAVLLVHDSATAEDVVQDSFAAMSVAWPRLRDNGKILAYLRQSVLNRSRSVLRRRQVADRHPPTPEPDEPSAEHGALTLLERSAVAAAIRQLPARQREVLVLRFYLDLPEAQIASAMGISRGAVKAHTARAKAALRGLLADQP